MISTSGWNSLSDISSIALPSTGLAHIGSLPKVHAQNSFLSDMISNNKMVVQGMVSYCNLHRGSSIHFSWNHTDHQVVCRLQSELCGTILYQMFPWIIKDTPAPLSTRNDTGLLKCTWHKITWNFINYILHAWYIKSTISLGLYTSCSSGCLLINLCSTSPGIVSRLVVTFFTDYGGTWVPWCSPPWWGLVD